LNAASFIGRGFTVQRPEHINVDCLHHPEILSAKSPSPMQALNLELQNQESK
jgi:hypothetical protein